MVSSESFNVSWVNKFCLGKCFLVMLLKINLQIQDLKKKQATLAALQEQAEETMRATQVDLRIKCQLGDGKALLFRGKEVLL